MKEAGKPPKQAGKISGEMTVSRLVLRGAPDSSRVGVWGGGGRSPGPGPSSWVEGRPESRDGWKGSVEAGENLGLVLAPSGSRAVPTAAPGEGT